MKWLAKYAIYIVLALAAIGVSTFVIQSCRDNDKREEIGRLKGKLTADSVEKDSLRKANERTLIELAVTQRLATGAVDRWRTVVVRDPTPALPPTATASDTVRRVTQQLRTCRDIGDSLVTAVEALNTSCTAYRDTAQKRIATLERSYSNLDSLYKVGKPKDRWFVGPAAGYGYTIVPTSKQEPGENRMQFERRIFVGVVVGRGLFSW